MARKALKIMPLIKKCRQRYPQWAGLFQHVTSPVDVREKFRGLFPPLLHKRRFISHIHTKLTTLLRLSLSSFNKLLTALLGQLGLTEGLKLVRPKEVWPDHA